MPTEHHVYTMGPLKAWDPGATQLVKLMKGLFIIPFHELVLLLSLYHVPMWENYTYLHPKRQYKKLNFVRPCYFCLLSWHLHQCSFPEPIFWKKWQQSHGAEAGNEGMLSERWKVNMLAASTYTDLNVYKSSLTYKILS